MWVNMGELIKLSEVVGTINRQRYTAIYHFEGICEDWHPGIVGDRFSEENLLKFPPGDAGTGYFWDVRVPDGSPTWRTNDERMERAKRVAEEAGVPYREIDINALRQRPE